MEPEANNRKYLWISIFSILIIILLVSFYGTRNIREKTSEAAEEQPSSADKAPKTAETSPEQVESNTFPEPRDVSLPEEIPEPRDVPPPEEIPEPRDIPPLR